MVVQFRPISLFYDRVKKKAKELNVNIDAEYYCPHVDSVIVIVSRIMECLNKHLENSYLSTNQL